MPLLLRSSLLVALGLALAAPAALAQRKPERRPTARPEARCARGDDDCHARPERRTVRRTVRRAAPDYGGLTVGLYGGSLDGLPTGGVRVGVGLARVYAEGSGEQVHHDYAYPRGGYHNDERPEVMAFGIDLTMPARHPGLRALYGVAGVGVQNRQQEVYYAYDADCGGPYIYCAPTPYDPDDENRFYGTLGLGLKLPLWRDRDGRDRVMLTGEVTGRFLASGRYDDAVVLPAGNVGLTVRLR